MKQDWKKKGVEKIESQKTKPGAKADCCAARNNKKNIYLLQKEKQCKAQQIGTKTRANKKRCINQSIQRKCWKPAGGVFSGTAKLRDKQVTRKRLTDHHGAQLAIVSCLAAAGGRLGPNSSAEYRIDSSVK